jgi:hypothetical protein
VLRGWMTALLLFVLAAPQWGVDTRDPVTEDRLP